MCYFMSEYVFVFVRAIEIIIVAQQSLSLGYLACAIGSKCVQNDRTSDCVFKTE